MVYLDTDTQLALDTRQVTQYWGNVNLSEICICIHDKTKYCGKLILMVSPGYNKRCILVKAEVLMKGWCDLLIVYYVPPSFHTSTLEIGPYLKSRFEFLAIVKSHFFVNSDFLILPHPHKL